MARQQTRVPFGYEEADSREHARGSLWVYDSFESFGAQSLTRILALTEERNIAKVIFYPLHEETLRRMENRAAAPYYRRVEALEALLADSDTSAAYTVEKFEGKRKKYTPADTAFRFLEEKYKGPFFIYVTADTAHRLAGYESFEPWIKKVRLFIEGTVAQITHQRLLEYSSRWERV